MIDKIKIKNFRCLKDVNVDLGRFNVLIGPNDSGKSTFLETLQKIRLMSLLDLEQVFKGSFHSYVWKHDLKNPITFSIESQGIGYEVSILKDGPKPISISNENMCYDGKNTKLNNTSNKSSIIFDNLLPLNILKGHLIRIINNSFQLENLRSTSTPSPLGKGISEEGFGVPSYLAALKLEQEELFNKILESMIKEVPRIKGIHPRLIGSVYELSFSNVDTGIRISARDTSDGVLLYLAYLCLLYSPKEWESPSVILLEEPENGLHPSRLESVVRCLKKLANKENGPQVILTTHSPYLLDYVDPTDVLVFHRSKKNGATAIKHMSEIPDFAKKRGEMYLGEFWTAFGEDFMVEESDVH